MITTIGLWVLVTIGSAILGMLITARISESAVPVPEGELPSWETVQKLYGEMSDRYKAQQMEIDDINRKLDGESRRVKSLMGTVSNLKRRVDKPDEVDTEALTVDPSHTELPITRGNSKRKKWM